jgi:FK506-binding protein 1
MMGGGGGILTGLLQTEQEIFKQHNDVLAVIPDDEAGKIEVGKELIRRGGDAFGRVAWVEADVLYAKACEVAPSLETVEIYVNRSKLKLDIGENVDALLMAEHALLLQGVSVTGLTIRGDGTGSQETWYRRGEAAKALERFDVAKLSYEKALEINPRSHKLQRRLKEVLGPADEVIQDHWADIEQEEESRDKHPGTLGTYNNEIEYLKQMSKVEMETLRNGDATNYPRPGQTVRVHYTGFIPRPAVEVQKKVTYQVFDSSRRRNTPFEFRIGAGHVIRGWDEAVLQMSKGQVSRIQIPPELAYGEFGQPPLIRPNATLVYEIEIIDWDALPRNKV